jgi:hypothetical protein
MANVAEQSIGGRLDGRLLDECRQPVSHVVILGDRAKISKRSGAFLWLEIIDLAAFRIATILSAVALDSVNIHSLAHSGAFLRPLGRICPYSGW